ncbi:MAG: hypothetical protein P1U56_09720 [Saprospiraceae bacterium]|nr:hypothetical protein [Saprospiraceae bacterium]
MLKNDNLLTLIRSMTKSEKRNFKLIAQKTGSKEKLYVQLFDHLDKYQTFDEVLILKKLPLIKKSQLSNLKSTLCHHILIALRDINRKEYPEIKARERFDFAKVLYAKGQYRASLDMLQTVKAMAAEINLKPLEFLALNFEKIIETQHVTKSMSPKAYELATQSNSLIENLSLSNELSNLSLLLYARYLENGYVKNAEEYNDLHKYFHSILPVVEVQELDFYQKLNLFQSYVWFYHMSQDFANYYRYALKWVNLFEEFPAMKIPATTLYIKGLHNVLNALFMAGKRKMFKEYFFLLMQFNDDNTLRLSVNETAQLRLFKYIHGINSIFMSAKYAYGVSFVQELETSLKEEMHLWDVNRIMVFNYKIACIYFGNGDLENTITYLNKVEASYQPRLKVDIQCFSRVLNLIAHYELGNDILVSYRIKSVFRFLLKMGELEKVHAEIFRFVRRTPRMSEATIIDEFKQLRDKLIVIEKERFEKRPFLYLDIISWLESKIKNVSMVEAILSRRASEQ